MILLGVGFVFSKAESVESAISKTVKESPGQFNAEFSEWFRLGHFIDIGNESAFSKKISSAKTLTGRLSNTLWHLGSYGMVSKDTLFQIELSGANQEFQENTDGYQAVEEKSHMQLQAGPVLKNAGLILSGRVGIKNFGVRSLENNIGDDSIKFETEPAVLPFFKIGVGQYTDAWVYVISIKPFVSVRSNRSIQTRLQSAKEDHFYRDEASVQFAGKMNFTNRWTLGADVEWKGLYQASEDQTEFEVSDQSFVTGQLKSAKSGKRKNDDQVILTTGLNFKPSNKVSFLGGVRIQTLAAANVGEVSLIQDNNASTTFSIASNLNFSALQKISFELAYVKEENYQYQHALRTDKDWTRQGESYTFEAERWLAKVSTNFLF